MQAWIYHAKDLSIISENTAARLFLQFRVNAWHRQEPGNPYPSETPMRMERLIYRALAEDLISRSRAQELYGKPLQLGWEMVALQQNDLAILLPGDNTVHFFAQVFVFVYIHVILLWIRFGLNNQR
jgi:hypothetical protein